LLDLTEQVRWLSKYMLGFRSDGQRTTESRNKWGCVRLTKECVYPLIISFKPQ